MQITCYPPLGGTTVVDGDEVEIVVCMDFSFSELEENSKAAGWHSPTCVVWHDGGGDSWQETPMRIANVDVLCVGQEQSTISFKTTLQAPASRDTPLAFTLKYTDHRSSDTTLWANHELQTSDSVILFRYSDDSEVSEEENLDDPTSLHTYFTPPPDQRNNVTVERKLRTENVREEPTTWAYNVNILPRAPSSYDNPGYTEATLGAPVPDKIVSHFATVKHGTAWVEPSHSVNRGRAWGGFHPPRECVMAAFQTVRGVIVFLPISKASSTLYLKGDGEGRVVAVGRNDTERLVQGTIVVVMAGDIETAVDEAFYWAKRISGVPSESPGVPRPRPEDSWSDALKYCTWNSLGRSLTKRRVVDAVDDLYSNRINIETIIIDDNWQSLDGSDNDPFGRRWTDFEANKAGFPGGLRSLVDDIKNKHRAVKHVAVWHGILGYWNGISPNGWIASKYSLRRMRNGIYVVSKEDVIQFYDDFYAFLYKSGITAVKADTQCLLDERIPSSERGELFPAYLKAWRLASEKYFGGRAISCMSMVPQILFTNHLDPQLPRFCLRNSDDFFPHTPDSHPWHIFANAHNALFTSNLNVMADWDMFQTRHDWGSYHAAARCLSGGPVYITDEVGSHDSSIVRKITAPDKDGRMVALRPDAAKSLEFFSSYTESYTIKITSVAGPDDYRMKLVGTFSLDGGRARSDMFPLKRIVGPAIASRTGGSYAVYSHNSRTAKLVSANGYIKTVMEKGGWDVTTVSPIYTARTSKSSVYNEVRLAVFGLLGQISGAAAITNVRFMSDGSTVKISIGLKALGVLGFFANYSDPKLYGRIRQVTLSGVDVPDRFIKIGQGNDYGTIQILVEDAWNALRLDYRDNLELWIHMPL
ncbi:Alpha-galactosidase [Drechslerella dactyloides]|uniref:Alpha-galactosidase n=1 Tax=Drechslerella dactyloides TaxID=74499 RepID=A0AAD6IUH0_DREDA|nr:Alpha-galactosidase [Drechslerella dactyloides]